MTEGTAGSNLVDDCLDRLNEGDLAAVEQVFQAYQPYLRIAVGRRLSRRLRTLVDSNDVVQSVFADLIDGVRRKGWRFDTRAHLYALLRRIAMRRVADRYQKHKQGMERERSLVETESKDQPAARWPRPSEVAQGHELWDRLIDACPPAHQEVVRLRRNGLRLAEIATRTGLHEGSVRRILYELARRLSLETEADGGRAELASS